MCVMLWTLSLTIARLRSGCDEKNAFTHTPGVGVVWDSTHEMALPMGRAYHAILPTKTSLIVAGLPVFPIFSVLGPKFPLSVS